MAIFAKRLNMLNSSGVQQTAKIYSTTTEAGDFYMSAEVDGEVGYIALITDEGSTLATSGRIFIIASGSTPEYTARQLTGTGTFTVPDGVTRIRVTCVGGGSSGAGEYVYYKPAVGRDSSPTQYNVNVSAKAGSQTKFGSYMVANGGSGTSGGNNGTTKYGYRQNYLNLTATAGAGMPIYNYKNELIYTAGAGGTGYAYEASATLATDIIARGGGSGYKVINTIGVTPGETISYSVGAGGVAVRGSFDSNSYAGGNAGSVGAIYIEYGEGIQF